MEIKYRVIKTLDSSQRTIVKSFVSVDDAIAFHKTLNNSEFHFYEIEVFYTETQCKKRDEKNDFSRLYKRVSDGESLCFESFRDHKIWIDKSGQLVAGDYELSQSDIVSFLEWADVVEFNP